ncbi:MAG TPA: reverse transcriptase family protein [Ignavibacteriaceae bacterium]|nr:reverse transcriptase family protein [Ignavibacteriaceae bacterium]
MGDFNFSCLDWSRASSLDSSHPFVDCMGDNFLTQHITEPTRGQNFLDLVITSGYCSNELKSVTVGEPFATSDHQIIRFTLNANKQTGTSIKKYNYFKADYAVMREAAENKKSCWTTVDVEEGEEVERLWKLIKGDILELREELVKTKNAKKSQSKWITKEVRRLRKRKKEAWDNYVKNGRNTELYETYKNVLNTYTSESKKAKYNYELNLANNIKTDCKSFYAYVNNKRKSKQSIGSLNDLNGNVVENKPVICNIMNDYFSSVFVEENQQTIPEPIQMFDHQIDESLTTIFITEDMVLSKLMKLNVGKSCGPDELHGKMLFELRNILAEPLANLFNLSITTGHIPQDWRDADVIPLYKKGSKVKPENYRPVSLTSIICKILESILKDAITSHLDKHGLIRASQHGFRGGRSCLTNLLEFFDFVTRELDDGSDVDIVYLDFSKAFDKVPHKRLIKKLKSHGIDGTICNWVENWLLNRRQRVCIDDSCSSWVPVVSGVPQGSVLGPLLFIIYINDIDEGILSKLNKFADDSKVGKGIKCRQDVEMLQSDLDKLSKWAEDWQMTFNLEKCNVLHCGAKFNHLSETSKYILNNSELQSVTKEKDLGVTIDGTMKFSEQCNSASNKANSTLGMIKRTISCKKKEVLVKLYKALVRPQLEYCNQMWRPFLKKDIEKLERVQRRATRMIEGCGGMTYEERLAYTGLPTLERRRDRGDVIQVFKMLKGIDNVDYNKYFTISNNSHTRGHSMKLIKNRSRLNIRQNYFTNRIINGWNTLPNYVVESDSVNCSKNNYDRWQNTQN